MAKLRHIAKEFELIHDALPRVLERVARVEEWIRIHPEVHRLESSTVNAVKEATDKRLEEMNNMRKQIDLERGTFVTRELYGQEHQHLSDTVAILRSDARKDIDNLREDVRKSIDDLRKSRDTSVGEKSVLEQLWPFLFATATFLGGHYLK